MLVRHSVDKRPMFGMDVDERAIAISALSTFCRNFPKDETAKRMLHTFEQIDAAYRIMAQIARESTERTEV